MFGMHDVGGRLCLSLQNSAIIIGDETRRKVRSSALGCAPEVSTAASGARRRPVAIFVGQAAVHTPLMRRWPRSRPPVACELLRFVYLSWRHPPFGHFKSLDRSLLTQ